MDIDVSTLSDDEIVDLMNEAVRERTNRQQVSLIVEAATNLIETAKNNGYSKTAVKNQLSNIVDAVYGTTAS